MMLTDMRALKLFYPGNFQNPKCKWYSVGNIAIQKLLLPFFVYSKSRPAAQGSTATRATSAKDGASAARLLVRSKLSDKNQKP